MRTYWLAEVDGTEPDTDSVQTEPEEPHERVAGEGNVPKLDISRGSVAPIRKNLVDQGINPNFSVQLKICI